MLNIKYIKKDTETIFWGSVHLNAKKNSYKVTLLAVRLFFTSLYLRNTWRYRAKIETIYSDLRPRDFLKKIVFLHLLKKRYGRL